MEKETKSFEQGSSSSTRKLFQRVFSENDEVIILQGLATKDLRSHENDTHTYNYLKEKLSFKPTPHQLKEKIRKLKKKFQNKVTKKPQIFPRQHDLRLYQLSKKVWIPEANELDDNGLKKMFKKGRNLLNKKKKAEFDERWKKLKLMKTDFHVYRSAFYEDLSNTLSSL